MVDLSWHMLLSYTAGAFTYAAGFAWWCDRHG